MSERPPDGDAAAPAVGLTGAQPSAPGGQTRAAAPGLTAAGPHPAPSDAEVRSWGVRRLAWDSLGEGACDLRDLQDAPAGRHGRVGARDGRLVAEDGTRMRFWGCNLVFGAAFPPPEDAPVLAERLARAGCNLVRVHHADSPHGPAYFDYAQPRADGLPLHAEHMARFDRLFAELRTRGLYLHLDLYTLRHFLPAEGAPEGLRPGQKHVLMYDDRLQRLYFATVARLLDHRNPHTGLRYADDPAVAVVQLLNEQSMQWWDGPPSAPEFLDRLRGRWNRWLLHRYGGRAPLEAVWQSPATAPGGAALAPDEDPGLGTVRLPDFGSWHERSQALRTARRRDERLFLWEVQVDFGRRGRAVLDALGYGGLMNLSNLPNGPAGLYALAAPEGRADLTENNAYWDHPQGGFGPPVRHHRLPMVAAHPAFTRQPFARNLILSLATGRVVGRPFIATEVYQAAANPWRAEMPLWLAAYACLQDWDGVLLFSYSHAGVEAQRRRDRLTGSFDAWNDPAVWDVLPAAALLFRRGDVAAARRLHVLDVADPFAGADGAPQAQEWWAPVSADAFRHRVAVACGPPAGGGEADLRTGVGAPPPEIPEVLDADTGELSWDRHAGILRLAAPRVAGAVGWIGGREVAAGSVRVAVAAPFAAVLAQSRDGLPLQESRHLLVTAVARAANEGVAWDGDTLLDEGHGPVHAEPVTGRVRLPWGEVLALDGRPHVEVRRG